MKDLKSDERIDRQRGTTRVAESHVTDGDSDGASDDAQDPVEEIKERTGETVDDIREKLTGAERDEVSEGEEKR